MGEERLVMQALALVGIEKPGGGGRRRLLLMDIVACRRQDKASRSFKTSTPTNRRPAQPRLRHSHLRAASPVLPPPPQGAAASAAAAAVCYYL